MAKDINNVGIAVDRSLLPSITPTREEYPMDTDIIAMVIMGPMVYINGVLSSSPFPGGGSILIFTGSIIVLNLGALKK